MLPGKYGRLLNEMESLKWRIKNEKFDSVEILQMEEFKSVIFLISGGLDSPYEGYCFRVKLEWPEDYPFKAPKCTFLDNVWNPYVNFKNGDICMDILSTQYTPALVSIHIILSIISLLSQDKISQDNIGFLNPQAAIEMLKNSSQFKQHARELCEKHSFKKKTIYSDNMRGTQQERPVQVQSHPLAQVIRQNIISRCQKKKSARIDEEYFQDYAFDQQSLNQSQESSNCSYLYQQSQVSNPFSQESEIQPDSQCQAEKTKKTKKIKKTQKLSDQQLKELIQKHRKKMKENLQKYGQAYPPSKS